MSVFNNNNNLKIFGRILYLLERFFRGMEYPNKKPPLVSDVRKPIT